MLSWQAAPQNFFFPLGTAFVLSQPRVQKKTKIGPPGERSVVDRCIFGEIDRAPFALSDGSNLRKSRDSDQSRARLLASVYYRVLKAKRLGRTHLLRVVEPPSPAATQRSAPGEAPGGSAGSVREDARAGVGPRRDGSRASVESRGGALAARRRRAVSETSESRVRVSRRWPPR